MVVVGEETYAVGQVDAHEESRPGPKAVVAEADPVVAHEGVVPEPGGGLSVVVSPDSLAVDFRIEFDHVSDSNSPRVGRKGGPEAGKESAAALKRNLP